MRPLSLQIIGGLSESLSPFSIIYPPILAHTKVIRGVEVSYYFASKLTIFCLLLLHLFNWYFRFFFAKALMFLLHLLRIQKRLRRWLLFILESLATLPEESPSTSSWRQRG